MHMSTTLNREASRYYDEATGRQYDGVMEVMDASGDMKIMWDKDNAEEVQTAREQFNSLTKDRKYRAFSAKADGSQGARIDAFDPSAERMILVRQYQGG